MNSVPPRESSIQHASRSLQCVARTLIESFCPIQMLSQTLRILIFHPLRSNRAQSDKRIQYLQPDRKSAGVASVEETGSYPCPRLARVRADQRDGRVSWSYSIYIYITAFGQVSKRYVKHSCQESRGGISQASHLAALSWFQRSGMQAWMSVGGDMA